MKQFYNWLILEAESISLENAAIKQDTMRKKQRRSKERKTSKIQTDSTNAQIIQVSATH